MRRFLFKKQSEKIQYQMYLFTIKSSKKHLKGANWSNKKYLTKNCIDYADLNGLYRPEHRRECLEIVTREVVGKCTAHFVHHLVSVCLRFIKDEKRKKVYPGHYFTEFLQKKTEFILLIGL